ncbi:MAG TPA: adenosine deaminase [Rhodothermales bacterium]|nr:adenosine deaminase [Rhodothermales bacterium]
MSESPTPVSRETILAWPKAELHCHLDGSVRLQTLVDLSVSQGKSSLLPTTDREALEEFLLEVDESESLEAYLSWFSYTIGVLQTRNALRRAALELALDAHDENIRYLEVRYSPILHTAEGMTLEEVNDAVLEGLREAEASCGIRTGLIICGLRDRMESASLRLAELAIAYRKKGVIGFDLAGGEAGNPPKHHLAAFYHARNNLLNLTVHAGESWGPDSIEQALFRCGAHRIGHGTSLYRNPDLLRYFVDHQIPLEICPTSNVQTHVVPSLEEHPLTRYVRTGVPVTVSTDNRLFSRTSVTDELLKVHQHCGLTLAELKNVVLNSFRHAFLPYEERSALVRDAESQLL